MAALLYHNDKSYTWECKRLWPILIPSSSFLSSCWRLLTRIDSSRNGSGVNSEVANTVSTAFYLWFCRHKASYWNTMLHKWLQCYIGIKLLLSLRTIKCRNYLIQLVSFDCWHESSACGKKAPSPWRSTSWSLPCLALQDKWHWFLLEAVSNVIFITWWSFLSHAQESADCSIVPIKWTTFTDLKIQSGQDRLYALTAHIDINESTCVTRRIPCIKAARSHTVLPHINVDEESIDRCPLSWNHSCVPIANYNAHRMSQNEVQQQSIVSNLQDKEFLAKSDSGISNERHQEHIIQHHKSNYSHAISISIAKNKRMSWVSFFS